MGLQIIQPRQELQNYVSHFWVARWSSLEEFGEVYYSTASTLIEFIFAFTPSNELLFSNIQGQANKAAQIKTGGFCELIGVSLHSYALPVLFNTSAIELNNQFITPDLLLGTKGKNLVEKIALATSTEERICILSSYLENQLSNSYPSDNEINNAVQYIRQCDGGLNIADLSSKTCLSQKQFERRFKAFTGFNPKLYSRIIRFENIVKRYKNFSNLTEAAHAFGYYDQAHFIHDFRNFSGYSPGKFFAISGY